MQNILLVRNCSFVSAISIKCYLIVKKKKKK